MNLDFVDGFIAWFKDYSNASRELAGQPCWSCMSLSSLQWNGRDEALHAVPAVPVRVRLR